MALHFENANNQTIILFYYITAAYVFLTTLRITLDIHGKRITLDIYGGPQALNLPELV